MKKTIVIMDLGRLIPEHQLPEILELIKKISIEKLDFKTITYSIKNVESMEIMVIE